MPNDEDANPVLLRSAHVAEAFHAVAFWCVGAVVLVSPWLFAARELWVFWPLAALLSLGCLFCGAATLVESVFLHDQDSPVRRHRIPVRAFVVLGLCAPFLVYAWIRAQYPGAPGHPLVALEANRSLLYYFTPVAIGVVMLLSGRRRGRAVLLRLCMACAALLAAYGLWEHWASGDVNKLWVLPNAFYDFKYENRLSATFYCPNHFSAWIGLAACVAFGAAAAPGGRGRDRILWLLLAVALAVVDSMSLSRGGMAGLFGSLLLLAPTIGLRGRRPLVRVAAAAAIVAAGAAVLLAVRYGGLEKSRPLSSVARIDVPAPASAEVAFADGSTAPSLSLRRYERGRFEFADDAGNAVRKGTNEVRSIRFDAGNAPDSTVFLRPRGSATGPLLSLEPDGSLRQRVYNPFMNRLAGHPFWAVWRDSTWEQLGKRASDAFWYRFDRGAYIGIALRAWRTNPVWGIGPGQTPHRSTQFAPTDDGVRPEPGRPNTLKRPRLVNDGFRLYEIHSDWIQLLEEYGIVGFALFCIPFAGIVVLLLMRQGETIRSRSLPALERGLPLGALFAVGLLSIQSLVDFSLQMPAVIWFTAWLVSAALLVAPHGKN